MFDYLRTLTSRQLQTLSDQVRLVVAHPNYAQQRSIMREFLRDDTVIYIRLEGQNLTLRQLNQQVNLALADQPSRRNTVSGQILILDECDRANPAALGEFLPYLLAELSPKRIVIFSREIPPCVLQNRQLRHQTSFIPNDRSLMLWDYPQRDEKTALLEVRAFGNGQAWLDGQLVDNWEGVLPRALFFYLVDRGMATRNDIFATFWPDKSISDATNVFHVTKRKINAVLGLDLTVYWSGYYRISPQIQLSYDAVLFTEMIQQSAIAALTDSTDFLTRAIAIHQAPFLSTLDMAWSQKRRSELNEEYSEALAALAKAKEAVGDKKAALGFYLRAAVNQPSREDFVQEIMRLYRELNMPSDALAVYERLAGELSADQGRSPSPPLQEFAAAIRNRIMANEK